MGNLAAVRGLLPELDAENINVLLLDIHAAPARDMLARFEFVSTPTFLVYDTDGQERYRAGSLPSLAQIRALGSG